MFLLSAEGDAPFTQTTIGWVIVFISVLIAVAYAFVNVRAGRKELGSEIELAPNRKPYYPDEVLEGKKLDRTLTFGLITLMICAVSVPLYWLNEPGRMDGAINQFGKEFASRGGEQFASTADGGLNCAGCHGGMKAQGGAADYTITDAEGHFVRKVQWQAPALDTVLLRYSREEVRFILDYGRPFSPMPAWGTKGGGPLNDQQVQNIVDYLASIQITPEQAQEQAAGELEKMMATRAPECVAARTREVLAFAPAGAEAVIVNDNAPDDEAADTGDGETTETTEATETTPRVEVDVTDCEPKWKTEGEALFNMGYDDGFAGGAYSCGRCHTQGWSYGDKGTDGGGAFGPNLTNGATLSRFPGVALGYQQQIEFIASGSQRGQLYGDAQGTGRMPGFGSTPEEKVDVVATGEVGVEAKVPGEEGMLSGDMIEAIVEYERSL
jgi:cytochrome c553